MVLVNRSYEITVLETIFWVWSFGFMMVGFTDEIRDGPESKNQ